MSDKVVEFSNEDEVIARFKEDWRGRSGYNPRKGRLPDFYTEGMKYYGRVIDGKLVGVMGLIDKGKYVILGGTWIHPQYTQKDSRGRPNRKYKEHGSTFSKLGNARMNDIRDRPKMAGFKYTGKDPTYTQEDWSKKMKEYFTDDSHEDIPEEMINLFRERYGNDWGIAKMLNNYSIHREEGKWMGILKRWKD